MLKARIRAAWSTFLSAWSGAGLMVCALLAILAISTLRNLITTWQHHPDYSHGWLMLVVTLFLFFRMQPWNVSITPMPGLGTATMLAGGILHLAAQVVTWPLLDYAGWLLLLRGLALLRWGREAARRLLPVLAYGVLMFPWPSSWLNSLAIMLQNLIAHCAEIGLNLIWVCHRRGHLLYLAGMNEPLSVAVECSGVRQLLVFLAMGWLLAFFLNGAWWRRLLLTLTSIPIAIIANVLRVFVLAMMARLLGPDSIQGVLHDLPLLLTLPLGGLMLWWCYRQLQSHEIAVFTEIMPPSTMTHSQPTWLPIGILSLLIILQISLAAHLNHSNTGPPVTQFSFTELPWQLGPWHGQPHPEADKAAQVVDFADALTMRAYSDGKGHAAAVYLVFSATGRDRLHHPEICLRDAGGAIELKHDRLNIPLEANTKRFAERFRYLRHRQERMVVYYWHYTFMPPVKNDQTFLQQLHQRQRDNWPGITVQVQTNMSDPASWKALETTLLPELDRWFREHVPASTQVGSARLPVRFTHQQE